MVGLFQPEKGIAHEQASGHRLLLVHPDHHLGSSTNFMISSWRRKLWGLSVLARHGKPSTILSFREGLGGLGDQLLLTTLAREFRQRGKPRVWVSTYAPEFFAGNPDIQRVVSPDSDDDERWFITRFGGRTISPTYASHIPEERRDTPPTKHLLAIMCEQAGISGSVDLRPYLYLTDSEMQKGHLLENQIAIQSTGQSSKYFMWTKEWYPERFQEVVDALKNRFNFVQVGGKDDPKLEGTYDLRGHLSIRGTAAILANSVLFVGLVGFLMHLARAVDCRATIVYGGRELPSQSGYPCNENLTGQTSCSPCWRYDDCPGQRACMEQITSKHVIEAVQRCASKHNQPLEIEQPTL